MIDELPDFFGRRFRSDPNDQLAGSTDSWGAEVGDWIPENVEKTAATLVTSKRYVGDAHAPVIDLDLPCHLVPSTTPGHGHLYINTAMPFADFMKLLDVMVEVGLVQPGFRDSTEIRGYASVRTPWTKKVDKSAAGMVLHGSIDLGLSEEQAAELTAAFDAAVDHELGEVGE